MITLNVWALMMEGYFLMRRWVASPPSSRTMLGCHFSPPVIHFSMHHLTKKNLYLSLFALLLCLREIFFNNKKFHSLPETFQQLMQTPFQRWALISVILDMHSSRIMRTPRNNNYKLKYTKVIASLYNASQTFILVGEFQNAHVALKLLDHLNRSHGPLMVRGT